MRSILAGEKMINSNAGEERKTAACTCVAERDQPHTTTSSENEAIARAQRGDPSAFECIYRRHSSRVYALCLRMVGNTAEAEDLTQDAFLMVFRKIRTFRGESAFSTWLHRITVNLVLMRQRRKTPVETPLEDAGASGSDRPKLGAELASADLFLAGSLDRLNLERALDQLRPFQKLVFVLHDIQGYKHTEIAHMMDWSIGNSKSRLHRARARLRQLLQDSLSLNCMPPSRAAQPAFSA
jgi:RNA polymerase sigma-70 factor, ECF subfamily